MVATPDSPAHSDPEISSYDFAEGVQWGLFLAEFGDDGLKSDDARRYVLTELVNHLEMADAPPIDRTVVRRTLVSAWADYRCHGALSPGSYCAECGACRSEDDA